jgi:phosphoribosylglycinamide formyltransferase-1
MKNIAIFASGSGSNAQNITEYFERTGSANVSLIFSNRPDAYVLERARNLSIPAICFTRDEFYNSTRILDKLRSENIDLLVLAGFLWLIPEYLILAFPDRIVNIHPALLPKYGGKGMYGDKVHQAVIENHEKESGISIHLVNLEYDKGKILFQAKTNIEGINDFHEVAVKVHALEYEYFPSVIEQYIKALV